MSYAENLRLARKEKGLTQRDLGIQAGVSRVSIVYYETGTRIPRLLTHLKLVAVLGQFTEFATAPTATLPSTPLRIAEALERIAEALETLIKK